MSCVLCVVDDLSSDFSEQLFAAQEIALALTLPLAVIHVIDSEPEKVPEILSQLRAIEQELADQNTPLMVLVGNPTERIEAVKYHLKPIRVVDRTSRKMGIVIKHPIAWTGTIISIDQLLASGFMCDD